MTPISVVDHHRNELVLLVEDHQHVREIIAETLEAAGFRVMQATCGKEFLEKFESARHSIQLLIADVDIPPPNGAACIRHLRDEGAVVPAIVITGTTAPALETELDGLAHVLRKPFAMTRLAQLASKLVEGAPV